VVGLQTTNSPGRADSTSSPSREWSGRELTELAVRRRNERLSAGLGSSERGARAPYKERVIIWSGRWPARKERSVVRQRQVRQTARQRSTDLEGRRVRISMRASSHSAWMPCWPPPGAGGVDISAVNRRPRARW